MPDAVLKIDGSLNGRDGSAVITISRGQDVLAVETLNILDSKIRDEYVREFCETHAGIAEEEFRAEVLKVADKIAKTRAKADKPNQAELLVELAMEAELFHTPGSDSDDVYATMTVEPGHRETLAII